MEMGIIVPIVIVFIICLQIVFFIKNLVRMNEYKNIFKCDVQIDDRLSHLKGDAEIKLMYDAYHNREYDDEFLESRGIKRVKSWIDIADICYNTKKTKQYRLVFFLLLFVLF